jgi:hypothetical protein
MGFETPSIEQPKSELDQVNAEIEATIDEIRKADENAPEMGWLKEKLQGLAERRSQLE